MVVLRAEVDDAHEIINQLKAQLKTLEQENLSKEQQIVSLSHRNHVLEEEAEENDKTLRETNEK
jgi:tropomyosin